MTAATTPYGSLEWHDENAVLDALGVPNRDLVLSTDEVLDRVVRQAGAVSPPTREQVVGALERLHTQDVLYRIGDGPVRSWRLLGNVWATREGAGVPEGGGPS